MGFIFAVPEGMLGAAAATAGLSAEAAGLTGPAAAAGAVVAPGLEEISFANAAKIAQYGAHVAAMLGMASTVKALYGASVGLSSATYSLADLMSAAGIGGVI